MLTGKNKRESAMPLEGTRIDSVTKKQAFKGPATPDFNDYKDNKKYWKIDELLHTLAQKYSKII